MNEFWLGITIGAVGMIATIILLIAGAAWYASVHYADEDQYDQE